MSEDTYRNAAICGLCEMEIESTFRHDFRQCRCGNLFVDGGNDYQRFGYDPKREDGSSMLWNNVIQEWISLKDLEADAKEREKAKKSAMHIARDKLKKSRKLMLVD